VRADGVPLAPTSFAGDGTPIFERIAGFGFLIAIEAQPGAQGIPPGNRSLANNPADRPDIQLQVDRELGDGSTAVCDVVTMDPNTPAGGVPGISPPSYGPGQDITDAINDLGCRFDFRNSSSPCTLDEGGFSFVSPDSTAQFCTVGTIDVFWRFHVGDTRMTARWRDQSGVLGPARSIIVRVLSQ
jgi:hypothetical protein